MGSFALANYSQIMCRATLFGGSNRGHKFLKSNVEKVGDFFSSKFDLSRPGVHGYKFSFKNCTAHVIDECLHVPGCVWSCSKMVLLMPLLERILLTAPP